MKGLICAVLLCVLCQMVRSRSDHNMKVNIYTRHLGLLGKDNVLICHVSQVSPPPEISIDLVRNGQVIKEAKQTDLAFEGDWNYYMTKYVPFTPVSGERYSCRVTCKGRSKDYEWEPDV